MSKAQFNFLMPYLRFDDTITKEAQRATVKSAPVRKIWDIFIESCGRHYIPHDFLIVNAQLLALRGKCPFRIYIPNKPAKYGITIIMANDVKTKYLLAEIPYLGKKGGR